VRPAELLGDVSWDVEEAVRWADEDGAPVEYRAWSPETSRVVSGPYGPEGFSRFPGRRFPSRSHARQYWARRAHILEEHRVPGRWIFRIKAED
jgi:hypothetical protein